MLSESVVLSTHVTLCFSHLLEPISNRSLPCDDMLLLQKADIRARQWNKYQGVLSSLWPPHVAFALTSSQSGMWFLSSLVANQLPQPTNQVNKHTKTNFSRRRNDFTLNPLMLILLFFWWGFPASEGYLYLSLVLQTPLNEWMIWVIWTEYQSSLQNTRLQRLFFLIQKLLGVTL